jgi:hypothetical protein
LSVSGSITAVHEEARASDEAGFGTGQESDEVRNFIRLSVTLKRDERAVEVCECAGGRVHGKRNKKVAVHLW